MSTRHPALRLLACVALIGEMFIGCAESEAPTPVDVYVDETLTVDLVTQEYDVGEVEAVEKEAVTGGCEVRAQDLPAGARLSGLTLRWTPSKDQIGLHDILLDYAADCQTGSFPGGHLQITVHDLTIMAASSSGATTEQATLSTDTGVHDLN